MIYNPNVAKVFAKQFLRENSVLGAPVHIEDLIYNYYPKIKKADFKPINNCHPIAGYINKNFSYVCYNRTNSNGVKRETLAKAIGYKMMFKDDFLNNPDIGVMLRMPPMVILQRKDHHAMALIFACHILIPQSAIELVRSAWLDDMRCSMLSTICITPQWTAAMRLNHTV